MNWVSKKLLISKLKTYFRVDNENNINVSLLGQKQIKCSNLQLKPEVINSPDQLIHIDTCFIKTLNISYGNNDNYQEPLRVKIDSVELTLKFNNNRKVQKSVLTKKKKQRPDLIQFYRAVGSQEEYNERNFIQEQIHQLKRIFGEYFLSKISFSVTNIDASVMCFTRNNKPTYFGITIEDINIKQKTVLRHDDNEVNMLEENRQLHGQLKNIGIYLGQDIQSAFVVKKQSALQKQMIRKKLHRQRKYLMSKQTINIFYNFEEKHLAIFSKILKINIQQLLIFELYEIVQCISASMQIRPSLRPGQGKIVNIGEQKFADSEGTMYTKSLKISEGTIQWWQVFGNMIIEKFNKRQNLNIIRNKKFKRYLFCLMYRYTFGAKLELQNIIDEYEFFKSDIQIMKYNRSIIEKVRKIQETNGQDLQCKGFVVFLSMVSSSDQTLKKIKHKALKYQDIVNSNVISNLQNCKKYMRIYNSKINDNINIDFKISSFKINICQSRQSQNFKNDINSMTYQMYDYKKKDMLAFYCDAIIQNTLTHNQTTINQMENRNQAARPLRFTKIQNVQEESMNQKVKGSKNDEFQGVVETFISLELKLFNFQLSPGNNLHLQFESLFVIDKQSNDKVIRVHNFQLSTENMHPQVYKWTISVEQRFLFKCNLIFVQLNQNFIEKCLVIKSFITAPLKQQQLDTRNFITKLIAKKIPEHKIFNTYSHMSKQIKIGEILAVVPVLDKDRTIDLSLKGVQYQDPVNEQCSFSIDEIFLIRSNLENIKQKFSKNSHKKQQVDKNVLLVNTQPLSGYQAKATSSEIFSLLMPFFLVQISCQDMHYFINIINSFSTIFSNPYYFPPPIIKKQTDESIIKESSVKFVKKMQNQINRQRIVQVKLQGIQFYFAADNFFQAENKFFGIMIDSIYFKKRQKFLEDTIDLSIRDIYIKNCLRQLRINKQQLINQIKGIRNLDDDSIFFNDRARQTGYQDTYQNEQKLGDLLLFIEEAKNKEQMDRKFLTFNNKSSIHLDEQKSISEIFVKIMPIFFFHNEKFFEEILTVFSVITSLSAEVVTTHFQTNKSYLSKTHRLAKTAETTYANDISHKQHEIQILKSKQFQELTYFFIQIDRLNFLALKQEQVVMTITFRQIAIKHKTQSYVQKFTYSITGMSIIDSSEQAGPYPVIIDASKDQNEKMTHIAQGLPIVGYFIQYNSQMLRQRQNKSAFFYMRIAQPNIFFLKKKIMELTNLLMNILNKTIFKNEQNNTKNYEEDTIDKKNTRAKTKFYEAKVQKKTQPVFCYYVEIVQPSIKLLRGSLSSEGFNAKAGHIFISNFSKQPLGETDINLLDQFVIKTNKDKTVSLDVNMTKLHKTDNNLNRNDDSFDSCSRIYEENYQNFQSFSKIDKPGSSKNDKIFIRLSDFIIQGVQTWAQKQNEKNNVKAESRHMMEIPVISMEFYSPNLDIFIPKLYGDMSQEDYRVLIRLTQDNLSETPLLFNLPISKNQEVKVSLKTSYEILEIFLNFRVNVIKDAKEAEKLIKNLRLSLQKFKGKTQMWTNSQNQTQLSILNLVMARQDYVSFISNRLFEQNNGSLPEQPARITYTDLDQNNTFKELESMNNKIWQKLKENEGDIFQIFKNQKQNQDELNYSDIAKGHARKQTNTQRICRWISGMCNKCLKVCTCCKKSKIQQHYKEESQKKQSLKDFMAEYSDEKYETSGRKNRNATQIFQFNQMLGFEQKISDKKINQKRKQNHMVYLDFDIKPNGQKHMYMQAKNMMIVLENQKALFDAISFLAKPYSAPDIPQYARIPKFNNYKPFKMVIQLNDSYLELKNTIKSQQKNQKSQKSNLKSESSYCSIQQQQLEKEQKIIIQLDTIYDSQQIGDKSTGPGKSMLRIQNVIRLLFISDNFKQFIPLSDQIKVTYLVEETVPYGQDKKKKSEQKILLSPYQKNGNTVHIKLPAFLIKAFMRIYQNTFPSQKSEEKQQNSFSKSRKSKSNQSELMRINQSLQRSDQIKEYIHNQDECKELNSQKSKEPQKKSAPNKDTFISRMIYIPDLRLQIEYSIGNSFLQTQIQRFQYSQASFSQQNRRLAVKNLTSILSINYWNLKVGKFEPCIEPWGFRYDQFITERNGVIQNQKKIQSNLQKSDIIDQTYYNDLNINFSIGLFQTFKELMIKYEQQDDEDIEICYDLTSLQSKNSNIFTEKKQQQNNPQNFIKEQYPLQLKSYFGRIFKGDEKFSVKRSIKAADKNQFNPKQLKLYVYHSYFDHIRRRKRLTYRTPYRIFNCSNMELYLNFLKTSKNKMNQITWDHKIQRQQYYSIPDLLYASDFLINFSSSSKKIGDKYVSARYLMETRAKVKNYAKLSTENKLWKFIFKFSSRNCDKLLDQSDLVLNLGSCKLCALSIKACHKIENEQKSLARLTQDYKLYDSYAIIMSPIIIQNFSYCTLNIKINRNLSLKIPSNQRVQLNKNFSNYIYDTIFEFQEDNFHREFQFLKFTQAQSVITMEIDKLQSLNLIVYRESSSTCQIQIYSDWNIENSTSHDFSLRFADRVFLIDQTSFSCLSDIAQNINLSIIGEQKESSKKIKTNSSIGQITLSKKVSQEKQAKLEASKIQHQNRRCCPWFCNSSKIYENIEFIFKIQDDELFHLSKRVQIKYKYQIRNLTHYKLKLCQHHQAFTIANLSNFEDTTYIFFYDFIPKMFFLQLMVDRKKLDSCMFNLEKFPGTSFAIKIKKGGQSVEMEEYYKRFYYLRVQIKRNGEETFIDIMEADFANFPIYLDNLTDYMIKIVENEEQFTLKPLQRIPFAWTQLLQEQNKLEVTINNAPTKTYRFNKKEAFSPITIIDKNKKKKKKNVENLYKKQHCYVSYEYHNICGTCLLILDSFDNKLRIHNSEDDINVEIKMEEIERMQAMASKIQIYDNQNRLIEIIPNNKTIQGWKNSLHECINQNVIDKIFFTIESYKSSRFFFFRTIFEDDNQANRQELFIKSLNLSIISSQPEQILLINCQELSYDQNDKLNRLNYKNLAEQTSQRVLTLKKLKISNQTGFVNPVVLSQIKKSNTPFLQVRLSRLNLLPLQNGEMKEVKNQQQQQQSQIVHYKQITVFMDEAQLMVEITLFLYLISMKSNIEHLNNQYAKGENNSVQPQNEEAIKVSNRTGVNRNKNKKLVALKAINKDDFNQVKQVYINSMQIKPLKMTISVNMGANKDQKLQKNMMGFLRNIPLDVQNAIIEINSFIFFHVFFDEEQLTKMLTTYYYDQVVYQMYKNIGSYDMLAPIQIFQGFGVGMKNIFYDPFYEFVKKKQIKAVGKKLCEGIISFIFLLLAAIIRLIDLVFKFLAVFTFDSQYKNRRESFRKQTFKSPLDGAILGGKQLWKVFKSFFMNFKNIGKKYSNCCGYILGFFISIISIIPWVFKLIVSLYDFIYVTGLGFVNWGYYQESAMKNRSRPPRKFQGNVLTNYNYRYAYAYELIKSHHIQEINNQQIYFVKRVEIKDEYNYLILSNYRILYNNNKITSCNEIKLYQVREIIYIEDPKNQKLRLTIKLSIPNKNKILLISYNVQEYDIDFSRAKDAYKFIDKLQKLARILKLNIQFNLPPHINQRINLEYGLVLLQQIIMNKSQEDQEEDMAVARDIMEEML